MDKRVLAGAVVYVVLTVSAFLVDPIVGTAVLVFGGALLAVGWSASTWDQASSYEERELVRSRKRAANRLANTDKRAVERARYQAEQARKAKRAAKKKGVTPGGRRP